MKATIVMVAAGAFALLAAGTARAQVPELPGVPEIPGLPGAPGVPELPGAPELPGVPGLPGLPDPSDGFFLIADVDGGTDPEPHLTLFVDGSFLPMPIDVTLPPEGGAPGLPELPGLPGVPGAPDLPGAPELPGLPDPGDLPELPVPL